MVRIKEQIKELVSGKPKRPDEENQEDQPAEVTEGATYNKGKYNREPRRGQHLYTYNCRTWWGGCFSAYSVGVYVAFSFLGISTLFSLLSCNACFSILSVNSLFSVLSVNSMFALGCVGRSFAICY
ncbi:hypothetical protein TrLO_g9071 [Triparma laevis f. longispina]|uniref:Uncharacterized protein n=1 Tax=Triparma laevis f. longispina TaxID=1714387 RepID=A0A9W7E3C2_9STRA|nr:hypothetical protein TrLO_g9071 [Triparma laevis f. longispina]